MTKTHQFAPGLVAFLLATKWSKLHGDTLPKTKMALENPTSSIGNPSSNGGFSICHVRSIFLEGGYLITQSQKNDDTN